MRRYQFLRVPPSFHLVQLIRDPPTPPLDRPPHLVKKQPPNKPVALEHPSLPVLLVSQKMNNLRERMASLLDMLHSCGVREYDPSLCQSLIEGRKTAAQPSVAVPCSARKNPFSHLRSPTYSLVSGSQGIARQILDFFRYPHRIGD
ncbi:hypothetical protein KP509_16G045100 [Ceratopteris richardii]|uniref:Uncharacterized protein n=1 Tax=Ceratopteris richardii TaxID=49495 RepID=A0A8T2T441_CERRI|nr:hypothetical protein KP509_16G045100 [Ceratopteris richardii]